MKSILPPISSMKSIKRGVPSPYSYLCRLRNRTFAHALGGAALLAPGLSKASEESRGVVENEIATEFYNHDKVCPNPYLDEKGRPKFAQGFNVDVHGHVIKSSSDSNQQDCRTHPWATLGASYTGTVSIPVAEDEASLHPTSTHLDESTDEAEDVGHLAHRFRLYLKFTLLNGGVDFGPVLGFGVGKKGVNTQAILGGFVSAHPDRKHQHEISLSARTGVGKSGVGGFESGLFYRYNLTRNLALGAHCILEGHDGDIHGGCGPSTGVQYKGLSLNAELALGPHPEGGLYTHTHLALMFDVMKFWRPNLPASHGHPPH